MLLNYNLSKAYKSLPFSSTIDVLSFLEPQKLDVSLGVSVWVPVWVPVGVEIYKMSKQAGQESQSQLHSPKWWSGTAGVRCNGDTGQKTKTNGTTSRDKKKLKTATLQLNAFIQDTAAAGEELPAVK